MTLIAPHNTPQPANRLSSKALLVKLSARPDFSAIEQMPRGAERKTAAYAAIKETALKSQTEAVALAEQLKNSGAIKGYETLVSPNMLVIDPAFNKEMDVAKAYQALEGVREIYWNQGGRAYSSGSFDTPDDTPSYGLEVLDDMSPVVNSVPNRPYGVDLVGAPEAWTKGATGEGLVYGSIDTGADTTHPEIASKYRGFNANGAANHDYNWFDATGRSQAPKDGNGHGTHTIGTVTGDNVGVAPGAKFIAASGLGAEISGLLKSIQWMMAPTKIDGSNPDPTKAADVVGMSWWSGPSNGDVFKESMEDLRAAGIMPVKSAGNQGPRAGSITSPGQFPSVVATAAVNEKGDVTGFSSRGPAPYPVGSTTPKPDFAAPGDRVMSSVPGGGYRAMNGTSMAQPHMSAVLLAMMSKYPQLSNEQILEAIRSGAVDKGAPGQDDEYGHGIVNIPAALEAAAKLAK